MGRYLNIFRISCREVSLLMYCSIKASITTEQEPDEESSLPHMKVARLRLDAKNLPLSSETGVTCSPDVQR